MVYQFRAQQALGFRLVVVPARDDFTVDVSRVVEAIDERTALVAVSHVLFKSSFILDPAPIVERARSVGAPVMLDLYQSAGIIPVDLTALGRGLRSGRMPEVALRRARQRVSLHAARPTAGGAAACHRLVLASRAVRVLARRVRAAR
jgi:cysteine sulfinate desulfinase/cysteine desulfurase-like protein